MISVIEALNHVLALAKPLTAEPIALEHAVDRILAEAVIADRNQPPFDASAMDGYAVSAADLSVGRKKWNVIGEAAAGHQACAGKHGDDIGGSFPLPRTVQLQAVEPARRLRARLQGRRGVCGLEPQGLHAHKPVQLFLVLKAQLATRPFRLHDAVDPRQIGCCERFRHAELPVAVADELSSCCLLSRELIRVRASNRSDHRDLRLLQAEDASSASTRPEHYCQNECQQHAGRLPISPHRSVLR